jgi:hypothetical protein
MKCYLLLIKGSFSDWNQLPEARRTEIVASFGNYAKELGSKGYLRGGDGCGERSFRFMTSSSLPGDSLLPLETKDMVTGYFLIEVPTEDEAINIARRCPAFECGEYVELVPCGH